MKVTHDLTPLISHSSLVHVLTKLFCQADVARLNVELAKARQTVEALQDKEDDLKEQLANEKKKKKSAENLAKNGTLSGYDKRPAALVRKYGELYAQTRLETLESLDKLGELDNHDDLKSKLLFSVIVVSDGNNSGMVQHYLFLYSCRSVLFLPRLKRNVNK